jgi:hypothetical protein
MSSFCFPLSAESHLPALRRKASTTSGGAKAETSPPISATYRTKVAVI